MIESKRKMVLNENEDTTALFLKKHVGMIHCENKLTLIQRKLSNILLFNALDKIADLDIFEISLKNLCSLVGYNSNDTDLIKKAIKSLMSVVMEWNLLEDKKFVQEQALPKEVISWHASSLLAGASISEGVIQYSYSPQIKSILSSLEIYGRINLFVQAKFNSTYSLVLYENCVRFKNITQTAWFSLELFRSLMGIAKTKYRSFKELKRNVITVAVDEVNNKSDIYVAVEYRKIGRQISSLRFLIKENTKYEPAFRKKATASTTEIGQGSASLATVLTEEFGLAAKKIKELIASYGTDYLLEKVRLVLMQKNVKNKRSYLLAAIDKNYAGVSSQPLNVPKKEHAFRAISQEENELSSLKKKYINYKFHKAMGVINQADKLFSQKVIATFRDHIQAINPQLAKHYQRNGFASPFLMIEWINFLENAYKDLAIKYQSFDEFISSEDEVV